MILIKRWENHVNIYATFVDVDNIDRSHTYEKVPDQSKKTYDIRNPVPDLVHAHICGERTCIIHIF
jgi:hypothetical protein